MDGWMDGWIDEQEMFIVMELVKGGELYKNISGRQILKEEEAYRIIKPLAECLAYMHRMGIIHRDIKVCNDCSNNVKKWELWNND